MKTFRPLSVCAGACLGVAAFFVPAAFAQTPRPPAADTGLRQFSDSIEALARRVNRSVVEIESSGFGFSDEEGHTSTISNQLKLGTGVILSADGYIVTNAHVVANARRIRVQLTGIEGEAVRSPQEAKLVGSDSENDLALIKIERTGLPFLAFADSTKVRQGQIVFAFGNPRGLDNSVTMGVVSSVARQISPDDPRVFIQTDAAINPGNSGGPLVNVDGEVVGINTFIITEAGGSEGIGFAIPSEVVRSIVDQLRTDGFVRRSQIGVSTRTITPALAAGLKLTQGQGVLVEDVTPDGPADHAGISVGDIILSIDDHPINDNRQFALSLYRYRLGDVPAIKILRGTQTMSVHVVVKERPDDAQRFANLVTKEENVISRLGILALTLDSDLSALLPGLRITSGVVVAGRTVTTRYVGDEIKPGDVIHALNGETILGIADLRDALNRLGPDDPVVLQVERAGALTFLVLEEN